MWKNRTKVRTAAAPTAAPRAWSMPPELERALPRNVELNPSGVSLAVIAVLLGVVAIGSLGAFAMARGTAQRQREALERGGAGVEAVVVRAGRNSGMTSGASPSIAMRRAGENIPAASRCGTPITVQPSQATGSTCATFPTIRGRVGSWAMSP